jgi:hypothetical protein
MDKVTHKGFMQAKAPTKETLEPTQPALIFAEKLLKLGTWMEVIKT